jgi:hypothetical protein
MKHRSLVSLALSSIFVASAAIAAAQDASTMPAPPKVLVIDREYLKPGKSGSQHVITESAFVKAAKEAKWPTHYVAMDSMSGPNRALFLFAYDSLGAWGKDQETQFSNPAFAAATDAASIADGELLSRFEVSAYIYHPEMSLHTGGDISHARYWEFTQYRIKVGHDKDWSDLVKIYTDGLASTPTANWAMYQSQYGENNGGLYVVITPMKTLAEADNSMAEGEKWFMALDPATKKRANDLAAACLDFSQRNIFTVNPKESYVYPEWNKSAPEIWGQP